MQIFIQYVNSHPILGELVSEWTRVNANVLQGAKLGPILFLVMVNNLVPSTCNYWKYVSVDDLTTLEVANISKHGNSLIQGQYIKKIPVVPVLYHEKTSVGRSEINLKKFFFHGFGGFLLGGFLLGDFQ